MEDEEKEGDAGSGTPSSGAAATAMLLGEQPPLGRDRYVAFPSEPQSQLGDRSPTDT